MSADELSEKAELASENVAKGLMPDGSIPNSKFTNIHLDTADAHYAASRAHAQAGNAAKADYHEQRRLDHCWFAKYFFQKMEPLLGHVEE